MAAGDGWSLPLVGGQARLSLDYMLASHRHADRPVVCGSKLGDTSVRTRFFFAGLPIFARFTVSLCLVIVYFFPRFPLKFLISPLRHLKLKYLLAEVFGHCRDLH